MKDKELNEVEFIEKLGDALEKAHDENRSFGDCPEGQRFGLRLTLPFPYITECGCWDEVVWPSAVGVGLTKTLGAFGIGKVNKYLLKKFIKKGLSDPKLAKLFRNINLFTNGLGDATKYRIKPITKKLNKLWEELFGFDGFSFDEFGLPELVNSVHSQSFSGDLICPSSQSSSKILNLSPLNLYFLTNLPTPPGPPGAKYISSSNLGSST